MWTVMVLFRNQKIARLSGKLSRRPWLGSKELWKRGEFWWHKKGTWTGMFLCTEFSVAKNENSSESWAGWEKIIS